MAMSDSRDTGPDSSPRTALDWAVERGAGGHLARELRRRSQRRRRTAIVTLATASCALGLGVFLATPSPSTTGEPAVVLQPAQRTLPDGSRVELREGAELALDFSGPERRVALTRGEAHFAVAKDASRPFVVSAGPVSVRALGTEFSVTLAPVEVAVLVTEGRVAVENASPSAATVPPLAVLDAGKQAVVAQSAAAPTAAVTTLLPDEVSRQLAWRVPRLELSGTPLAEAVTLFNAHGSTRLKIGHPKLGQLRVSGIVRADNPEALLQLLEANFDVTSRRTGPDEITIERRP